MSQARINELLVKIQEKTITAEEHTGLTNILNTKLTRATTHTDPNSPYNPTLDPLAHETHYGNQCVYEEFAKISKLSHELSMAGMNQQLKLFYIYLLEKNPENLSQNASHTLNMNNDCYGMFGPALYASEEEVKTSYDTEKRIQNFTYKVGNGTTHQQFTLDETLQYRHSIHIFFGDLLKLCTTEDGILEDIALPLLKKLIRSEAEITVDFINTLMEFVPKDAMEAAMKVAGKFVKAPEPQKAAAAAPEDDDEELEAAVGPEPHHSTTAEIRPAAIIRACDIEAVDTGVLDAMSNGDFAYTVKTFKDPTTGNSLLHFAAQGGAAQSIRTLIKYGADMGATNIAGQKPIDLVAEGNVDVLQAFATAEKGRMTPISGALVEFMDEICADLDANLDLEEIIAKLEASGTAQDCARAKYLNRDAEEAITQASIDGSIYAILHGYDSQMANIFKPIEPAGDGADAAGDFDLFA